MSSRSSSSPGPNWSLFAKLAFVASVAAFVAMVWPAGACALSDLLADGDTRRAGAILQTCQAQNPILASPAWLMGVAVGGAILGGVLAIMARVQTRRQRSAFSAKQRAARASLRKERESRPSSATGHPTVPEPPIQDSAGRSAAFRQEPSGVRTIVDASDDPLAKLDAMASASGARPTSSGASPFAPAAASPGPQPSVAQSPFEAPPTINPFEPQPASTTQRATPAPERPAPAAQPSAPAWPSAAPHTGAVPNSNTPLHSPRAATSGSDALPDVLDDRFEDAWSEATPPGSPGVAAPTGPASGPQFDAFTFDDGDTMPALEPPAQISDTFASFGLDEQMTAAPARRAPAGPKLAIAFRTPLNTPLDARTVRLQRTSGGPPIRAWVGTNQPGLLAVGDLPAGTYAVAMEDGCLLGFPHGDMRRAVEIEVSGAPMTEPIQLHAQAPRVVYASSYATPGTASGDRDAPFPTIRAALEFAVDRRRAGDPTWGCVEVRVDPTAKLPSARHGLSQGAEGTQWTRWWSGQTFDASASWTRPVRHEDLRAELADTAGAFAEDLRIDGLTDVRIVNSAYAGLRDRVALSPGFEVNLESELGAIPLAMLRAPGSGPSSGFRLEITSAQRVHIEGVHLVGCEAQSGVAIRHSESVTLRRCWIDLFASGSTRRSGVFGVGRGVQIDESGGTGADRSVLLDTCDIGWNRAARRAVPIRGAGVAIVASNVEVRRCHVHDNVATQEPPDLAVQGDSSIRGGDNHRAGNEVLRAS